MGERDFSRFRDFSEDFCRGTVSLSQSLVQGQPPGLPAAETTNRPVPSADCSTMLR